MCSEAKCIVVTSAEICPCCSRGRTITMRGHRSYSLRSQNQCPLTVSFLYIQIVGTDRVAKLDFFDSRGQLIHDILVDEALLFLISCMKK